MLLAVNPFQELFTHLLFDFGVCRIVNQIRALGRILFQVIEKIVRVCVGGTGGVSVYAGRIDRIEVFRRADAAAAATFADLREDLVFAFALGVKHYVRKVFADHLVADVHARERENRLWQARRADQIVNDMTAIERAAFDYQRHAQARVVAGALVIIAAETMLVAVAGAEMQSRDRTRKGSRYSRTSPFP